MTDTPADVAAKLEARADGLEATIPMLRAMDAANKATRAASDAALDRAAASMLRECAEREKALREALEPIAEAMKWEEAEGNFGASFMPDAPAERFRDEVELRIVAWWGKDWELESADTFCTLGDLRRAAKALEGK